MNSFVSDFGRPLEPDKVFSRQGNEESRSLFHCYINEVDQLDKTKACFQTTVLDSNVQLQEAIRRSGQPEEELNRLMKFDIPNFVNTDQNSSFGEDDLLISEPPIVLENKPVAQTPHKDLDWEACFVKCIPEEAGLSLYSTKSPFTKIVCVCIWETETERPKGKMTEKRAPWEESWFSCFYALKHIWGFWEGENQVVTLSHLPCCWRTWPHTRHHHSWMGLTYGLPVCHCYALH